MRICVYGASSPTIDPIFIRKTEEMGAELARRGHSMVFGGGANGLMGAAARGVRSGGGHIIGVIPKFFDKEKIEAVYGICDETVMPDTMRQRKQIMEEYADAFVMTPGGIGTFEEFFEILTSKQLCRHNKPIAIFNIDNYFAQLLQMMAAGVEKNFIRESVGELYFVTDDVNELFAYLEAPIANTGNVHDYKEG